MMMRYHFGLGVGHTYLHYEPSDSIGVSNIEESEDDNDGDNMDFHPPFNSSANPQPIRRRRRYQDIASTASSGKEPRRIRHRFFAHMPPRKARIRQSPEDPCVVGS